MDIFISLHPSIFTKQTIISISLLPLSLIIYYDSISSLFYVSAMSSERVAIFDKNCDFQMLISFDGYSPSTALSYFNGNFYSGDQSNNILVASKETSAFVAIYNSLCEYYTHSITIDSFGFMAVGCRNENGISLYNAYNGTYLNLQLATSNFPELTAVDASGRFVSIGYSIDIYY